MSCHLAIDLGAESGRVISGKFHNGRLTLEELHRFPTRVLRVEGSLRWDIDALWREIREGLRRGAGEGAESVGVDSWALDYVLMRAGERIDRLPFCYRDARTKVPYRELRRSLGEERIYAATGVQFMPINTVYQLAADAGAADQPLSLADRFLMIGDWFQFLLSGRAAQEESNASTTQLWDPVRRAWAADLIKACGLPLSIFPKVIPPCTRLGPLLPEVQRATGMGMIEVIAGCVHDTGAAVAAVPASGDDWAYVSSGTWSLLGVELPRSLITEEARAANFTNETGVGGTSRFLRNASGMWLLQECRRAWAAGGEEYTYAELIEHASKTPAYRSLIDPDDLSFLRPEHMPTAIAEFCIKTDQPVPVAPGDFARCVLESLALLYDSVLDELERVTGRTIRVVHIVGGGSQNTLLNQITADVSGRHVVSGPVEATAIGNVLLQALTLGHLGSQQELRDVVRRSFPTQRFEPRASAGAEAAKERFRALRVGGE
jgi:rhamnulokinase